MKNYLMLLFCFPVLFAGAQAQDRVVGGDALLETIESQKLIFHWRYEPRRLATVLVYTCPTCDVEQKTIDRETRLIRGEEQLDISFLEGRMEWDGHVTISSDNPKYILKIEIFE